VEVAAVAAIAIAAITAISMAWREALRRTDRAATAEVATARAEGAAAGWQTTADTEGRLRRAESARADALEQELADADQDASDHPQPGARERVLAGWRRASAELAAVPGPTPAGGDGEGPVSDPAAADREP
jgi:hypothetical protein